MWTITSLAPQDSPLVRAVDPDGVWDLRSFLLHSIEFNMRVANWYQTEDGHKNRKAPKPIPAPWVDQDEDKEVRHFGADPVPLGDLDAFLGWPA